MISKYALLLLFFCPMVSPLTGQPDRSLKVTLMDGHRVGLYRQATQDGASENFLYVPFNFRLAESKGEKDFTFLAYREDSTSAIIGGIMHLLLTWGPTPAQEREISSLLRMRTDGNSQLAGGLMLEPNAAEPELEIGPVDHPLAQLLLRSLNSASTPPLTAGAKMAVSFHFSAEDAQLMAETMRHPEDWKEVHFRIYLDTFGRNYRPAPPTQFILTKSFASCLESL